METARSNKFDANQWIAKVLNYENYLRLMVLLFLLGLTAGLSYFVYSRAVYSSRALVKVSLYDTTADEKGNVLPTQLWKMRKQLLAQFRARHLQAQTAAKLGFVSEGTSYAEMRSYAFPSIRVEVLDDDYISIYTASYYPQGVREYPQALIDEYLKNQALLRQQYREEAILRYTAELTEVRGKLDDKLSVKLSFEESHKLAEVYILQNKLSSVPVNLVLAKDRLKKMQEIRRNFLDNEDRLDVIDKLSLLNRFKETEPAKIGKMIRSGPDDVASPIKLEEEYLINASTNVVIQPDMVEGLIPWQKLEKKKRVLEDKLKLEKKVYGEDHPKIKELTAEMWEINEGLLTELEVDEKNFSLELTQLQMRIGELESKLPEYHKATRAYDEQRLDYDLLEKSELAWGQAHKRIAARIEGLEFGEGRTTVELQMAGFAELRDEDPISPNKMKLMIMGIVMGLALAVGVPFLIEMFDDTAATLQQLENVTGLSGIGVVPLTNQEDLEDIVRSPTLGSKVPNFLLETFRVIRSNVILNPGPAGMTQVVMVTSACPGEGKTTQAANLAWAFSSMGEKTLLVDCDLRRGRVHALTKIDNQVGMTALLTAGVTENEVMQSIGVENLTVIPRGPVVPGATEILCQKKFDQLMEGWRKKYDRIVMDTPPVLGLSETVALQRLADGLIVVVQAETTSRKDVARAVELLRKTGAHFFGFVLNRVDLTRRANYYNYYYYSSRYYDDFIDSENNGEKLLAQETTV